MKRFCTALALLALAAACNGPADTPATPAAPVAVALSAGDQANRDAALARVPAGASPAVVLVEGNTGFLVYQKGATATVETLNFDGAANVTSQLGPVPVARPIASDLSPTTRFDSAAETATRATVTQFYYALSHRDHAVVGALLAPNYVDHAVSDTSDGGAALVGSLTAANAPALAVGPVTMVAQGDLVAAKVTVGVGQPPAFSPGADIFRIQNGKIVERWRINY